MPGCVSRREFFGQLLGRGLDFAAQASGLAEAAGADARRADLAAIAGDFTPEMLALEAERLGLDPGGMDRETLLAAVLEAMNQRGGRNGPGGPER